MHSKDGDRLILAGFRRCNSPGERINEGSLGGRTNFDKNNMESKGPTHIFIVENDKIFVRMLDYVFSKSIQYRFVDHTSGESALKNLHLAPRVIVLDYSLPGMNGFETLQEIKEQYPGTYVLSMISRQDGRLPVEFLNAGAAECIVKDGTEVDQVIERLENYFKNGMPAVGSAVAGPGRWYGRKMYYALLILLLLSIGFYYYQ